MIFIAPPNICQTCFEFNACVRLERLKVEYKSQKNIHLRDGKHHHVTKKEFCRLIKGGTLLPPVVSGALEG